uniref:Uncharacterized protein n=1 Tax=Arundo donax TaxID=35708 RepID=A0A0A9HM32_ARUDO
MGCTKFGPWKRVWRTWAPLRCKFFIWLAINNRCWTADRLAKRGLQHPAACPLCDQAGENIQHLLVECVFARQVWVETLQRLHLGTIAPQPSSNHFSNWWRRAMRGVAKEHRKGLNSLVILIAWEIWKHRNDCVFNNARPSVVAVIETVAKESALWCSAGAKHLYTLLLRSLTSSP